MPYKGQGATDYALTSTPDRPHRANLKMPVKNIESHAEFSAIIKGDRPAVIDFWAPWCPPCKAISPTVDKLAALADNDPDVDVGFYKVDIDALPSVAEECGIKTLPYFLSFKGGELVGEVRGAHVSLVAELASKAAGKNLTANT